jgi:hypothetical protein
MNWKYLLIGLVIIFIPFGVLFARISSVSNTTKPTTIPGEQDSQAPAKARGPEDLSSETRKAVAEEGNALLILSRGRVINFEEKTNTLQITAENQNVNGVETRTETIDLSSLKQVKCWPEKVPVGNGQEASILKAYFPMKPDSELYLTKEIVKSYEEIKGFLKPGVFAFVKRKTPSPDPTFTAEQLAIIGC